MSWQTILIWILFAKLDKLMEYQEDVSNCDGKKDQGINNGGLYYTILVGQATGRSNFPSDMVIQWNVASIDIKSMSPGNAQIECPLCTEPNKCSLCRTRILDPMRLKTLTKSRKKNPLTTPCGHYGLDCYTMDDCDKSLSGNDEGEEDFGKYFSWVVLKLNIENIS
jgi:hypothetical protein